MFSEQMIQRENRMKAVECNQFCPCVLRARMVTFGIVVQIARNQVLQAGGACVACDAVFVLESSLACLT